ncbi:PLAC8 family protein [Rhodotorula paludigena]|uniref:PLAC8 family protein n=1 Tax=Rhodotorula paludigena TaxID=86838 RepID=UPI0031711A8F
MVDHKQHYEPLSTVEEPAPPAYEAAPPVEDAERAHLQQRTQALAAQQPLARPQMTVRGVNPKNVPVGLDGKRDFTHGLCEWYEAPGLTVASLACPCMVFSANRDRLAHLSQTGTPHPAPLPVGLWCGLYALAPHLAGLGQAALQCMARFQTRERYGVRGNIAEDALIGAFCLPCSLVQESRELSAEEQVLRAELEGEGAVALAGSEDESEGAPTEVLFRDEEEAVQGSQAVIEAAEVTKKARPTV